MLAAVTHAPQPGGRRWVLRRSGAEGVPGGLDVAVSPARGEPAELSWMSQGRSWAEKQLEV